MDRRTGGTGERWIPGLGKVRDGQDEVQGAGRTLDWIVGSLAPHVGRWLLMVWDTIGTAGSGGALTSVALLAVGSLRKCPNDESAKCAT